MLCSQFVSSAPQGNIIASAPQGNIITSFFISELNAKITKWNQELCRNAQEKTDSLKWEMAGEKKQEFKLIKALTEARGEREMIIMESIATPRTLINLSPLIQP